MRQCIYPTTTCLRPGTWDFFSSTRLLTSKKVLTLRVLPFQYILFNFFGGS